MAFLDTRSYDGTPISRRTTDGYVNATAMCKANGKLWGHYFETDRATRYLEALSETIGIPMVSLYQSEMGRNGGTWVHPQVAVDLARWISAPFAVWMDGWFLESTNGKTSVQREPVAALPEAAQRLEWLMGFCDRWSIQLDQRDMLHIKEHAQSLALPPAGQGQAIFNDYPVSRLVQDLFQVILTNKQYAAIGKALAKLWRREKGIEPSKHDQYVDGACRAVAHYTREWAEKKLKDIQLENPEMFTR